MDGDARGATARPSPTAVRKHKAGRARSPSSSTAASRARPSRSRPSRPRTARAMVGITMQVDYKFPFKVEINVGDVGGPSAGMMFSLGIVDKLTPGAMTGGQVDRRDRDDHARGRGRPDRRHPAEDGRRPRGRGDGLPHPGRQLRRGDVRPSPTGSSWSRSKRSTTRCRRSTRSAPAPAPRRAAPSADGLSVHADRDGGAGERSGDRRPSTPTTRLGTDPAFSYVDSGGPETCGGCGRTVAKRLSTTEPLPV